MATLLNSKINCIHLGTNASNSTTTTAFGYCTNCGAGNHNTAIGWCSLTNTTSTGCRNTVVGANSGRGISTGVDNTIIGFDINNVGNGNRNTIVASGGGADCIRLNDNNNYNTILLTGPSRQLYISQANFCGNVFLMGADGQSAAPYSVKSMCNIFIGYPGLCGYTQYDNDCGANIINIMQVTDSNQRFRVGYNYAGDCSISIGGYINTPYCNSINIGGSTFGDNTIYWARSTCNCTYVAWTYGSDSRDKTDVENISNNLGLNFIRKLRPISFRYDKRQEYVNKCDFEYGTKDGTLKESKKEYGFIAQEVKTAIDELNVEFEGVNYNSQKDLYTMSMRPFLPVIVKALQELDNRVKTLKTQLINNP